MFTACLDWREERKVDTIDEWWPTTRAAKALMSYYPWETQEGAKGDRVLAMDWYASIDPQALMAAFEYEDLINFHIYVQEYWVKRGEANSERLGRPITDFVIMFNLEGLATRHLFGPCMSFVQECFKMDEMYYVSRSCCLTPPL